jgi:hypothetical protein
MEVPLIRNPCEKLIRADYMLKLFQQTLAHSGNRSQAKTPSRKDRQTVQEPTKGAGRDDAIVSSHTHLQYNPYPTPSVESGQI